MRHLILVFTLFTLNICVGQKIVENKTDKFTDEAIIRTDWQVLLKKGSSLLNNTTTIKYRFSKINNILKLDIKMILNGGIVYSIKDGFELIFLSEENKKFTYLADYTQVASRGGGSTSSWGSALFGLMTSYSNPNDPNYENLKNMVKELRIYTDEGYFEAEIKSKHSKILSNSLNLINKTKG